MKLNHLTPSQHRVLAAFFAAALGVLICLGQRHFTLSLIHPQSFIAAAHHRCALCLYAAFAWLFLEFANLSARSGFSPARAKRRQ